MKELNTIELMKLNLLASGDFKLINQTEINLGATVKLDLKSC